MEWENHKQSRSEFRFQTHPTSDGGKGVEKGSKIIMSTQKFWLEMF